MVLDGFEALPEMACQTGKGVLHNISPLGIVESC